MDERGIGIDYSKIHLNRLQLKNLLYDLPNMTKQDVEKQL